MLIDVPPLRVALWPCPDQRGVKPALNVFDDYKLSIRLSLATLYTSVLAIRSSPPRGTPGSTLGISTTPAATSGHPLSNGHTYCDSVF